MCKWISSGETVQQVKSELSITLMALLYALGILMACKHSPKLRFLLVDV